VLDRRRSLFHRTLDDESWQQVDDYNIEIVGSDIDTRALKAAAEGIYGNRALMRLSHEVIGRYFRPLADRESRAARGGPI
jgi:chemotaxis methyl-accepting protein methylase